MLLNHGMALAKWAWKPSVHCFKKSADLFCEAWQLAWPPAAAQSQCLPPLAAYGAVNCSFESYLADAPFWSLTCLSTKVQNPYASARNRIRVTSMATMYSATRPLMPLIARTPSSRVQMDAS